ncbi:MAG TPA: TonB-dependent receptor [Allosphingosinicella sp.]|jgi:vitamin B12 transporter|nr:TonB-dependent receptor [Allosphingosinicella sp.]
MSLFIILIAATAAEADPAIIVTGSRETLEADEAPVSATVLDEAAIQDLALPSPSDLLRLTPGVAVATSGPRGSQTQLRIRGAEANHTLLFLDGIRFNDPAAGNEARFELLSSDLLSRIEIVRGPQSALWGSEAVGGVVAVTGADPFEARGLGGLGEYGSLDSARVFGRHALASGGFGVTGAAGWQRSEGIDSFGSGGDHDGFDNFAGSLKAIHRAGALEVGAVAHWIEGRSEFDGFDPVTFRHADTLDATKNRIGAVRGWGAVESGGWSLSGEVSYLDSANRNFLGDAPLNTTFGDRLTLGAQLSRTLGSHRLTAAVDRQQEHFRARDTVFFGGTDQDRSRSLTAVVAEWRADWSGALSTDFAVRHDSFSAFEDATTLRGAVLVRPAVGWTLHASYGEGIAQPTFYDLYGFFPGSFRGNPGLRPERSRGWEAGIRRQGGRLDLSATYFRATLDDEIVEVFTTPTTTANATGRSRRQGVELTAGYRAARWLNLAANYTWLDADEQRMVGSPPVREVRRPRSSANLIAHGDTGALRWGAAIVYVGSRRDVDSDSFAAVTLHDYLLASLNVGYRIRPELELFARIENAFAADYQDVAGYNTAGRTAYAGLRVALGR